MVHHSYWVLNPDEYLQYCHICSSMSSAKVVVFVSADVLDDKSLWRGSRPDLKMVHQKLKKSGATCPQPHRLVDGDSPAIDSSHVNTK
jgi:hypothetical protein